MRPENKLIGANGCELITGTDPVTGKFFAFVVNEDAVVAEILDENGTDQLSAMGLSGNTIKAGIYVPSSEVQGYFSSIDLASGSVMAYKIDE